MSYALRAEWTKLRSLRSTTWLAFAIAAAIVLVTSAAVAGADVTHCPTPDQCFEDIGKLSLKGVWLGQALVVVFAVLAMSNEYGTGMIQTTLVATPRRHKVLLTKAAVVVAAVLGVGVLGVLGSLAVSRFVLPGNGFSPLSFADGSSWRASIGTVLYLGLVALLSLGLSMVIRDTAGTITAVLALLYIAPVIGALVTDPTWRERLDEILPMTAGLAIQATRDIAGLPIGPWSGLGVLAAWAAGAMLVGGLLFAVRDA
jgi:ABC-2 type transport system permease protein